jgi:hypothetical protein
MRVLFIGALAATLVGCTTVPHPEAGSARKSVASGIDAKNVKSSRSKKTKGVARVARTGPTTASRAAQPKADPITEKAKAAVAALLENPASAEFYNLQRAQRTLLHARMDSICGYVRAGGDSRGMPFLYTIGDGEAYLVNGRSQVAETVHGAVCK